MKNIIFLLFPLYFLQINGQTKSLYEELLHSTVRIECTYKTKDIKTGKDIIKKREGSAFFFNFKLNDSLKVPVIVTNKHVIENSIDGVFYLTRSDAQKKPVYGDKIKFPLNDFQSHWIVHPDSNIDLCIMSIAPILEEVKNQNISVFYRAFNESLIPTTEEWNSFDVLEEIIMIGYPLGLWDRVNNLPITRVGQSATPLKIDYMEREEFLINIPVFPGSSGSPIILYGQYAKGQNEKSEKELYLLGILYESPMYNVEGVSETVISKVPVNFKTVIGIPVNIGLVIKSSKLLDFKEELKNKIKVNTKK